jgi:putative ABC transport system permease protein
MGALLQDLRYALRMLAKSPGFTVVAILTLALGIGANAAIFSLTDQVLLRRLPVQKPQELVVLHSPGPQPGRNWSDGDRGAAWSYPMYKDLRDRNQVFSGLLARFLTQASVSGQGQTELANAELVTGNYFEVLGVRPALGRVFSSQDETAAGANPAAVLSGRRGSHGCAPIRISKIRDDFEAPGT